MYLAARFLILRLPVDRPGDKAVQPVGHALPTLPCLRLSILLSRISGHIRSRCPESPSAWILSCCLEPSFRTKLLCGEGRKLFSFHHIYSFLFLFSCVCFMLYLREQAVPKARRLPAITHERRCKLWIPSFFLRLPMPHLTDCSLKRFGTDEYHCSRYCSHFVLIFMLKNRLQFTEKRQPDHAAGRRMVHPEKYLAGGFPPSPNAEYYYIHFQADYTEDPHQQADASPLEAPSSQACFCRCCKGCACSCTRRPAAIWSCRVNFSGFLACCIPRSSPTRH